MTETSEGTVGLVVKLPFATPEEFLARYGRNVTRGGIYLRAKAVKAPGTPVALDLRLATGERLIYASARVEFVTGQQGTGVSGMGLKFITVDPPTQRFLDSAIAALPHARSSVPPLPPNVGTPQYAAPVLEAPAAPPAPPPAAPAPALAVEALKPSAPPPPRADPPPSEVLPSGVYPIPSDGTLPPAHPPTSTPPPAPPAPKPPSPVGPPPSAPTAKPATAAPATAAPAAAKPAPAKPVPAAPPALRPTVPPPTPSGGGAPKSSAVAVSSNLVPSAPPFEEPTEEPKRTGPIIGIDLGTTNSCAGFVEKTKPGILPSREGHNTVPSIIALNARGKLVIGHPAKGQMLTNPRQTVYGAKRLVGRAYDSPVVQQIKDRFSYEVAPGANGDAAVKLGDRVYTLQQISAMVLKEVRELAQNRLGQPVSRAVITVPAYYSDNQRQAVREAGRLAGLHVERILNEPTAAALAYGYGRKLQQRILVYDLGGGTFDASVLELHENVYEVISTGGDTFLGGIDFDAAIVSHLMEQFQLKAGQPFQGDRVALQRVTDAAERAKCALSERAEARIHVPFVTLIENKPFDMDVTLTRTKLVELTSALVDRTLKVCGEVLAAKNLTPKDIDEVVLVGGQSRFPLVHEKILAFFGKPPSKGVHPDEAVALGAALLAHSLGQREGVVLIDVLPMAIGIALPGGRFKPVLERNTSLPSTKRYQIATRRDGQRELELTVFQGDSDKVAENEYLGTLRLAELPKGPRGSVEIEVSFEVSNESLLTVSARELSTGKQVTATLFTRDTPATMRNKVATLSDPNLKAVNLPPGVVKPPPVSPGPTTGHSPAARPGGAVSSGVVSGASGSGAPGGGSSPAAAPSQTPSPAAIAATRSPGFFGWFKRLFVRD